MRGFTSPARAMHDSYARGHARTYIRRPYLFDRLDAHAAGHGLPLVVVGGSGAGKSALLANWALERQERLTASDSPSEVVVPYFVDAARSSGEVREMIGHLIGEVQIAVIDESAIIDPLILTGAYPSGSPSQTSLTGALAAAVAHARVILIIDGVDQLDDQGLSWLPETFPEEVRLVVSTAPGGPLEERWSTLDLEPLSVGERVQLIEALGGESVAPSDVARIAAAPQTSNPLFLRALLSVWPAQTHAALTASDVPGLYRMILSQLGFAGEALQLIWAARRGLSEHELRDLIGPSGPAGWDRLPGEIVTDCDGRFLLRHEAVRVAVVERYLSTAEARAAAHGRLARYFGAQPPGERQLDELLWQLPRVGDTRAMVSSLADDPTLLRPVAESLHERGDLGQAYELWGRIAELHRRSGDRASFSIALGYQAQCAKDAGELDQAYALFVEAEPILRELGDIRALASAITGQANVLRAQGDRRGALDRLRAAEKLYREAGSSGGFDPEIATSVATEANILQELGELDDALELGADAVMMFRQQGHRAGLARALHNTANVLQHQGELEQALRTYDEAEQLFRELGERLYLAMCLQAQAAALQTLDETKAMLVRSVEAADISRSLGRADIAGELAASLVSYGTDLQERGRLDEAAALLTEAVRLFEGLARVSEMAVALNNLANTIETAWEFDRALTIHHEVERLFRELGEADNVEFSQRNQARVAEKIGRARQVASELDVEATRRWEERDLEGALELLSQRAQLCLAIGEGEALAVTLGKQASTSLELDQTGAAISFAREARLLAERFGMSDLSAAMSQLLELAAG